MRTSRLSGIVIIFIFGVGIASSALAQPGDAMRPHGMMGSQGMMGSRGGHEPGHASMGMRGGGHSSIPKWFKSLDDEQKKKMDAIQLKMKKALNLLNAQIQLKRAELRDTFVQDAPDTDALHAKVSEVADLERQLLTVRYDLLLELRNMLTPEQRMSFDLELLKKGVAGGGHRGKGHGHRKGHGKGRGDGHMFP